MTLPISTLSFPHLSTSGIQNLRAALDNAALDLPGCFLVVASANEVLFEGQSGPFNILLGEGSPPVGKDTIIWMSSATRLVVCLAYLQLVDRGVIALDTPLDKFSPELSDISGRVLKGFDSDGQPIFELVKGKITLRTMLNGTSGFAAEYSENVTQWKCRSLKGKGYINSCKAENLIYTPPCAQPGECYTYGTSIDWLSFIFSKVAGQDLESYLQTNIFRPLGILTATFFPHDSDMAERVMPLHWMTVTAEGNNQFEEWTGQHPSHLLPKKRADIEYPAGGSGLYSTAADFAHLLQNVLKGYQAGFVSTPKDFIPILSPEAYKLVLSPDLTLPQLAGQSDMMNSYFALTSEEDILLSLEDVNVSLGNLPMYVGKGRKGGWGRRPGSAGWGGAAGTDFYIDPATGIVVVFSTQVLPGSSPRLKELKKGMEKAVFAALENF